MNCDVAVVERNELHRLKTVHWTMKMDLAVTDHLCVCNVSSQTDMWTFPAGADQAQLCCL